MKRSVRYYVAAIVALNLVATVAVAFFGPPTKLVDWKASIFFAMMGLLATLLSYERSGSTASGSVSFLPFLSGVLVSPTLAIIVSVSLASFIAYVVLRRPFHKVVFNASQYGIATTAAVLVLAQQGGLTASGFTALHAMLFGIAALAFLAANTLLVVGVIALAERKYFWQMWRKVVAATLVFDIMGLPIVALLAFTSITLPRGWLVAIVLPLLGLRQLYKQNAELEKVSEDLLVLIAAQHEAQDAYTSGHSRRVASYAAIIARTARMPARVVERIRIAALLHDVGKVHEEFAPILRKPGRLTDEERKVLESHPVKGAELVDKVRMLRALAPDVRAHHERWDGSGYPDKLAGEAIPIGARVLTIADTIDAMMSSRPYRAAMEMADVKREIERCRGSQFDPHLVDALLTDIAWARLQRAIRRSQTLRPGETLPWDEVERLEATPTISMAAVDGRPTLSMRSLTR